MSWHHGGTIPHFWWCDIGCLCSPVCRPLACLGAPCDAFGVSTMGLFRQARIGRRYMPANILCHRSFLQSRFNRLDAAREKGGRAGAARRTHPSSLHRWRKQAFQTNPEGYVGRGTSARRGARCPGASRKMRKKSKNLAYKTPGALPLDLAFIGANATIE